ncbi:MAG TPA: hypothetical protein VLV89_00985 [Candidatus Acidoferrum sp.]|nr:hypothetical protein [Candidatus Acidoferrum sp.]
MAYSPLIPGARWLRCDLHVHTPFDPEKQFGENIQHAIEAFKKERTERLAGIAENFVAACRRAAGGNGIDVIAITDHNSITGYARLKPFFESIGQRSAEENKYMPAVLPGVEFSVGGERPLHLLVVFAKQTPVDAIEGAIRHCFQESDPFDPRTGTPRATGNSVNHFLKCLYDYCRPASGDRNLSFVIIPAHADSSSGVARETTGQVSVATSIWDEMRGHLRERVITRRDWHGFQTARPFDKLPVAFQDLLLRWTAARKMLDWETLTAADRARLRGQRYWPLIEASDPHNYEAIGTSYTWLKMEVADVEGIRLALLDPESRLRRMSDGPPGHAYPVIDSITVRNTDFFDSIEVSLNPCLNTFIGGRGSGKSTVIECLRYGLDRARPADFDEDEAEIREVVNGLLQPKNERDFGETPGTLLPSHEITLDLTVSERKYRVCRNGDGISVTPDPGAPGAAAAQLDVRALIFPRILSQKQIARIAKDPTAQRRELDALGDPAALREFLADQARVLAAIKELQLKRKQLNEQLASLPSRETELRKVTDRIAVLEKGGNKETLANYQAFQGEQRWVKDASEGLSGITNQIAALLGESVKMRSRIEKVPDGPSTEWKQSVLNRVLQAIDEFQSTLTQFTAGLITLRATIAAEQQVIWQPKFDVVKGQYEQLRAEMQRTGADFSQHERLLDQRNSLEREIEGMQAASAELLVAESNLRDVRRRQVDLFGERLARRRELAGRLETADADIRLEIIPFGDQRDFVSRKEEWFGGAGLQDRDWEVLTQFVYASPTEIVQKLHGLVEALRTDIKASLGSGRPLELSNSAVGALIGTGLSSRLTRYFFNALQKGDRIRTDEMECFLPEDLIDAKVRSADGTFKPITQGSVGQKSMAVVSLLLSAGDQPLIIDQPEDDLDNQYVYGVVVDLLRKRKFSRQIIVASHNANIPVNGDAELIAGFEVQNGLGKTMAAGSIDRAEIKEFVSVIMEGSAEAFRLRKERYGF